MSDIVEKGVAYHIGYLPSSIRSRIEELFKDGKITTKGKGSGFGVSLYTANIMARSGSTYEDIINKFYSGVAIVSR